MTMAPTTLDEAVEVLIRDLTPESRNVLAAVPEEKLVLQELSIVGDYCRECLGLDNRNYPLALDCDAGADFENAVRMVIQKAWERLRTSAAAR